MSEALRVGLGLLALAAILVPIGTVATLARRRWLAVDRTTGLLVEAVLGTAALVLLIQLLGGLRVYGLPTLLIGAWLLLLGMVAVDRRWPRRAPIPAPLAPARPAWRFERPIAAIAVLLVVVAYATQTVMTLRVGIRDGDSLWYHLPFAARYAATGNLWPLHHIDFVWPMPFYPQNTEALWSVTIVTLQRDLLIPVLNLLWLTVGLLSGWVAGARRGNGPLGLLASAALLGTPVMVATQGGTARNDLFCTVMGLAAVALLLRRDDLPALRGVAGLAAGLAVGAKLSMLGPMAFVTLAVLGRALLETPRAAAVRRSFAPFAAGLIATGIGFFVRNVVTVGSPTPWMEVSLGPVHLSKAEGLLNDLGPATFPSAIRARRELLGELPSAYTLAWGRLWPLLLGAAVSSILLTWRRRGTLERWLAVAVPAGLVVYLFTPGAALGSPAIPRGLLAVVVAMNSRYVIPTLGIGLLLSAATADTDRWRKGLLGALGLTVLGQIVSPEYLRSFEWRTDLAARAVAVLLVGALLAGGWLTRRTIPSLGRRVMGAVVALSVLLVAWAPGYDHRRLAKPEEQNAATLAYPWFADIHDQRVATGGGTPFIAPFYGPDLSNHVDLVGRPLPHGGWAAFGTCESWRAAVDAGAYDLVVLAPAPFVAASRPPPERAWLDQSAATLVHEDQGASLWSLSGPLGTTGCP